MTLINPQQLDMLIGNTVAVRTTMPEKRAEWRKGVVEMREIAQNNNVVDEVAFFNAILNVIDGVDASLPDANPYREHLLSILKGIASGGPPPPRENPNNEGAGNPEEAIQAMAKIYREQGEAVLRQVLKQNQMPDEMIS